MLLGYYPGLVIDESLPLDNFYRGPQKFLQDILAPFHLYLTAAFQICCEEANDVQEPSMIKLVSSARALRGKQEIRKTNFELILKDNAIFTFKVMEEKLCLIAEYQG